MSAEQDVKLAEARVTEARSRLTGTLGDIQRRVHPQLLLRNAWDGVREHSVALADEAVETAKARPGAAAGVIAGVVAVALRRPIGRLFRRLFRRRRAAPHDQQRQFEG